LAAHDSAAVQRNLLPAQTVQLVRKQAATSLDALVEHRAAFLTGYQNAAYAQNYRDFVAKVRSAESTLGGQADAKDLPLSSAVARYLFKLMAYKDEYEVARLHSDPAFKEKISTMFEGDYQVHYHLAPPLLAKKDEKGRRLKQRFGPWMGLGFRLLAPLKVLRGTALDIFGYSEERQGERALLQNYRHTLERMLAQLNPTTLADALRFAKLPEEIRGFGHVKARHIAAVKPSWEALGGKLP
jgi:indolepyruvate ferredoxin oxidoreductase